MLDESNCKALGFNFINDCLENQEAKLSDGNPQDSPPLSECTWYRYIIYFLLELKPPDEMGKSKARYLKLKVVKYCLIDQVLYWRDPLGVFLRCLNPQEAQKVTFDFHSNLCGGHHF